MRAGVKPYGTRPLAGLLYSVSHHTTGPNSLTALDIARYQVGPDSPIPYPAIAYHDLVLEDGTVIRCHPAEALTWHCGSGSESQEIDDQYYWVGSNNWESYGIAFTGENPTPEQVRSLRWCADDLDRRLGRKLTRIPHRVISRGLTSCPGDGYMTWWGEVL